MKHVDSFKHYFLVLSQVGVMNEEHFVDITEVSMMF